MTITKNWYVVMMFRRWDALEYETNLPIPIEMKHEGFPGTGFMPIFETREEAEAFADGKYKVSAIQETLTLTT